MKLLRLLFIAFLAFAAIPASAQVYEFTVVTSIESIVPMGLGRSRLLMNQQEVDHTAFTTERTAGTDSGQKKVKRRDLKVDELEETKLLNFYSGVGINFQNIASNDAMITSMLNDMSAKGWELYTVVSGVESEGGDGDGQGIFITRYIFRKPK